jgi:uncharacterized protein YkwD
MVSLLNADRGGIGSVGLSGALNGIAQWRAQDMICRNYFAHNGPPSGAPFTAWGENIAYRYPTGSMEDFNAMFISSPDHYANIMNPAFHRVGIGVAAGNGKVIVVEIFTD